MTYSLFLYTSGALTGAVSDEQPTKVFQLSPENAARKNPARKAPGGGRLRRPRARAQRCYGPQVRH